LERQSDCREALRRLLSRTTPAEAAALLLREVFEFDHAEISRILRKHDAATRQFLHRARLRAQSEAATVEADDAVVALCAGALECRAPERLIDLIQTRAPCVAVSAMATAAPLGLATSRRSPTASAQLVQLNGRYVIALVMDGIVLCAVPVGITEGTATCV
jgi:RNA polymerase sigma-70 factor (ECF subfamily)